MDGLMWYKSERAIVSDTMQLSIILRKRVAALNKGGAEALAPEASQFFS
jgi:hypothetical protein